MGNSHERKFIVNMLIGLILTTAGICCIVYASFVKARQEDWIFWSIVSAITINSGLLFLCRGVVHKVKADLIRRQKQKLKGEQLTG